MIKQWDRIVPQIEEMMIESQYSLPEFKGALLCKTWPEQLPFDGETVHHEALSITFTQLCNFFDLINGDDRDAHEWLRGQLLSIVDTLLAEYADEIAANEAQRLYLAELNQTIEEGSHV